MPTAEAKTSITTCAFSPPLDVQAEIERVSHTVKKHHDKHPYRDTSWGFSGKYQSIVMDSDREYARQDDHSEEQSDGAPKLGFGRVPAGK